MKKTSFIFGAVFLLLSSCSKETVEQEIYNQSVVYKGKTYELEFIENKKTGEVVHSEKNKQFKMLTDNFEESVLAVFDEKAIFFETREDYFEFIEPKVVAKSNCGGIGNAITYFYNHSHYRHLLVQKWPDQRNSFNTFRQFWGSGSFNQSQPAFQGEETTFGYKIPYVGDNANDRISSVRTEIMAFSNEPNPLVPWQPITLNPWVMHTDFTNVMFQHANYGGRALAIHTSACLGYSGYDELKYFGLVGFRNWNDKISSCAGYFLKLNWVN